MAIAVSENELGFRGKKFHLSDGRTPTIKSGGITASLRQLEILAQLAQGKTNKEAAAALFISPETIKTHLEDLRENSGAKSTVEITARAYRLGFLFHLSLLGLRKIHEERNGKH